MNYEKIINDFVKVGNALVYFSSLKLIEFTGIKMSFLKSLDGFVKGFYIVFA